MTGNRLAGVLIGLAGVALMIGPDALEGIGTDVLAQLAVLAAALSYAFAGVFGRRFARLGRCPDGDRDRPGHRGRAQCCCRLALLVDRPWTLGLPSAAAIAAILGIAALSTALGYVLYFRILAAAGAHQPAAGDVPHPGERDRARCARARRASVRAARIRHGADRDRFGGDRRAAVAAWLYWLRSTV